MGMIKIPFGHGFVTRIEPAAPPNAYKTYSALFPVKTHFRKATCEEIDCEPFLFGWATTVDTATELGQKQYHFITHDKERTYTAEKIGQSLVKFTFASGQPCFARADHKIQLSRPGRFITHSGDFRLKTGPVKVHKRPEDWVEDFAGHQDRINTRIERG
jgi:hypothetical protein